MTKKSSEELIDLILSGTSKNLEFCDDNIDDATIARHLVAFSNAEGGTIIFGIDDDGQILGLMTSEIQYRIAEIAANMIFPVIYPEYYAVTLTGKVIGVVEIPAGSEKPHYFTAQGRQNYTIRAGKTSRKITANQLQSFFGHEHKLRYELSPVGKATRNDLDSGRLASFLQVSRGIELTTYREKEATALLVALDILTPAKTEIPTVAGLLLFGANPGQFLAQSKISVVLFSGTERNQESVQMEVCRTLAPVRDLATGNVVQTGALEEIFALIVDHLHELHPPDAPPSLPAETIQELLLNAFCHRDYADSEAKILVEVFSDRIEITSPGTLSPEITPDQISAGRKATRNPLIYSYLAEIGYIHKNDLPLFNLITRRHPVPAIKRFEFDPQDKQVRTTLAFL